MKATFLILAYLATSAIAMPKHSGGGNGVATTATGKKTAQTHATKPTQKSGSHTAPGRAPGVASGTGSYTATGVQSASTGQSTGDSDPKDVFAACEAAPNCKITTNKNGQKDITITAQNNNRRRKAKSSTKTSTKSPKSTSSSSSSSSSSDNGGTTYKTFINYSNTKVEYGCEENENDVDIPGMISQAVAKCKSASCTTDGWSKQITWVEPKKGDVASFGKSATLSIVPSGYYPPEDFDFFAQAMKAYAGKGIQKWQQTHEEQKFKRDFNETELDLVARDESPVLGPNPQTKCWLYTQTDQISINRFAYQNGKSTGGFQMKINVVVDVQDPDTGFCGTITGILGSLGGLIPDIGGPVAAFFGVANAFCPS